MADREHGTAAPNQRQGQNQQQNQLQQNQDAAGQQHIHINWSNFKPEFSGKPEDVEAHLLCSNDWMNAHHFAARCKGPKILSYITRRGKIVVPILRAFRQYNMATIAEFI